MTESFLEKVVPEQDYRSLLDNRSQPFFRLIHTLLATQERWQKRHYFLLLSEADELESFLDDYGARWNRTYNYFTELTASVRGLAIAGLSLEHLSRRMKGYGVLSRQDPADAAAAKEAIASSRSFVQSSLSTFLGAMREEAAALGLTAPKLGFAGDGFAHEVQRFSLPRNVGQEEIQDEEQRIAEVASKYLQACAMFDQARVRQIEDGARREDWLREHCSEELARVYEATVHNLQSAYDTHIKNTVLEAGDERLSALRGHVSSSLHLLEAVTQLTHFVERHESGERTETAERLLADLVDRGAARAVTLNQLLYWAARFLDGGREIAEQLLPSYTNVQTLEVEVAEGVTVHARPASLIVAIVNHYGTPVEMEVRGQMCNAGSILELMIVIGSYPDARKYTFHGDENPLRDIGLLFESRLGEDGIATLPDALAYLRNS